MAHFFSTRSWIVRTKTPIKAKMRLFCFPYAGGGASAYQTWTQLLPDEVEMCAVQLPGRENRLREQPYYQLKPLVETLAQELEPYLDLPLAFFGHSLGALIAFELARHLRNNGYSDPAHLFVSGCQAPHILAQNPPLHNLSETDLITELHHLKGTSDEVLRNPELMQLIVPILRADFSLFETYTYTSEDPLACSITAFAGQIDPRARPHMMLPWRQHTNKDVTIHTLPGTHFFLHESRSELLKIMNSTLQEISAQKIGARIAE